VGANIEPTKAAFAMAKVIPNPKDRRFAPVREMGRVKYSIGTDQVHLGCTKRVHFLSSEARATTASFPRTLFL
jgi:hypothetical protein